MHLSHLSAITATEITPHAVCATIDHKRSLCKEAC